MVEFVDLGAQYKSLKKEIDSRIQSVLDHAKFISGPEVKELEGLLCKYLNVDYSITCANGTDAIQLSLMALGVSHGDLVLCPSYSFFATAEAISLTGACPVFVDIELSNFNLCPKDLEEKILDLDQAQRKKLKAIVVVDLFGMPADFGPISEVANKYNLKIVKDGAQSMGAKIDNEFACSQGDISTTSFFPAKPLGCYGDGGAVFTSNPELAEKVRSLSVHGKGMHKYDNVRIGMNSRLDTIQAAILIEKLKVLDVEIEKRNGIARFYQSELHSSILLPEVRERFYSSWAQFVVRVERRELVTKRLDECGIPWAIYYPNCIHESAAYSRLNPSSLRNSELASKTALGLPMHPYLDLDELDLIVQTVNEAVEVSNV